MFLLYTPALNPQRRFLRQSTGQISIFAAYAAAACNTNA
jgi:hypothetical protein